MTFKFGTLIVFGKQTHSRKTEGVKLEWNFKALPTNKIHTAFSVHTKFSWHLRKNFWICYFFATFFLGIFISLVISEGNFKFKPVLKFLDNVHKSFPLSQISINIFLLACLHAKFLLVSEICQPLKKQLYCQILSCKWQNIKKIRIGEQFQQRFSKEGYGKKRGRRHGCYWRSNISIMIFLVLWKLQGPFPRNLSL